MAAKVAGTWMALKPAGVNPDDTVGTTQLYPLGYRVKARDMGTTAYGDGEFIYLKGVTSTARGSLVLIKADYTTSLSAARDKGALAIALGICDSSSKYGWYQVLGQAVVLCQTVAAAAPCYLAASGTVDDAVVAGDQIIGMRTVTSDDTSTCVVLLGTYPATADFDNA